MTKTCDPVNISLTPNKNENSKHVKKKKEVPVGFTKKIEFVDARVKKC